MENKEQIIADLREGYRRILHVIGPEGAAHSLNDLILQIKYIKQIALVFRCNSAVE